MTRNDDEFSELFDEVYPGLCRFLECLVGRHNMAQDIAQETFLRLYKLGPEAPPRHEARFWLYRVARNLALNEINKRKTPQRLWQRVEELFQRKETNPATDFEQYERGRKILLLLQTLPEDQRASLLLREQSEMKYREIAGVLGVTESKVKADIFRARCAMRARWKMLEDPT
jgi:RNA polymerase sigma-70 factor (ECF subfamily)